MSELSFSVILDAKDLEDRIDALYYFMKYKLRKAIREALIAAGNAGYCKVFKLRDLVIPRKAHEVPRKKPDEIFYLIEAEDVDGVTGDIVNVKMRAGENFANSSYPLCKPGDLIYLRIRPYLRKVAIVPNHITVEGNTMDLRRFTICCSGEFYVLTPQSTLFTTMLNRDLLQKFLWVYLRSEITLFQVLPLIIGATRPRVNMRDFMNILVALPGEGVIRNIVEKAMRTAERVKKARVELIKAIRETQHLLGVEITSLITKSAEFTSMSDDLIDLLFESGYLSRGFFMGLER